MVSVSWFSKHSLTHGSFRIVSFVLDFVGRCARQVPARTSEQDANSILLVTRASDETTKVTWELEENLAGLFVQYTHAFLCSSCGL